MARPKGPPKKALTVYLPACMVDELRKARGEISDILEEALMFRFQAKKAELDAKEADEVLNAEVKK